MVQFPQWYILAFRKICIDCLNSWIPWHVLPSCSSEKEKIHIFFRKIQVFIERHFCMGGWYFKHGHSKHSSSILCVKRSGKHVSLHRGLFLLQFHAVGIWQRGEGLSFPPASPSPMETAWTVCGESASPKEPGFRQVEKKQELIKSNKPEPTIQQTGTHFFWEHISPHCKQAELHRLILELGEKNQAWCRLQHRR